MANTYTYSFKNASLIFGTLEIQGFSDADDCIVWEYISDQFSEIAGAKGDVVRSQTNDDRIACTVKLHQESPSNKALLNIFNADKLTGAGVFPIAATNLETGETNFAPNAWIVKPPTQTRGRNQNDMTWVFRGDAGISTIT
jgi:hypothetical protein